MDGCEVLDYYRTIFQLEFSFRDSKQHAGITNYQSIDFRKLNVHFNASLRKNGVPGDFRFIIIHRVYYPESSDNRQQNLLMSIYSIISKIGIDEPKALGLDTSMVVVERVPLIINHRNNSIKRITYMMKK